MDFPTNRHVTLTFSQELPLFFTWLGWHCPRLCSLSIPLKWFIVCYYQKEPLVLTWSVVILSLKFYRMGCDRKMSHGLDLHKGLKTLPGDLWPSPPRLYKISSAKLSQNSLRSTSVALADQEVWRKFLRGCVY